MTFKISVFVILVWVSVSNCQDATGGGSLFPALFGDSSGIGGSENTGTAGEFGTSVVGGDTASAAGDGHADTGNPVDSGTDGISAAGNAVSAANPNTNTDVGTGDTSLAATEVNAGSEPAIGGNVELVADAINIADRQGAGAAASSDSEIVAGGEIAIGGSVGLGTGNAFAGSDLASGRVSGNSVGAGISSNIARSGTRSEPIQTDQVVHTRHEQKDKRKMELRTEEAKDFCAKNCVGANENHCNLPHEKTCYLFYHCYNGPDWVLVQEICAFGSYYNRRTKQCDHARNVDCPTEECDKLTEMAKYSWNADYPCNRAYWECVISKTNPSTLMSEPRCCGANQVFDPTTIQCVNSEICRDACPLSPNERCRIEDFVGFQFAYNFTNCREYYQCDEETKAVMKCCPKGESYQENVELQGCYKDKDSSCEDECIVQEECLFEPVTAGTEEDRLWYYMEKGFKRACAPGTVFIKPNNRHCHECLKDPRGRTAPDCVLKVLMPFNTSKYSLNKLWTNYAMGIEEFTVRRKNGGVGVFNSKAAVTIENYHGTSRAFEKGFYLEMAFKQTPTGNGGSEILLSSCQPVIENSPSLHIVLENNRVIASIITDTNQITTVSVDYEPNQRNELIFDVRSYEVDPHQNLYVIQDVTLTVTPENPVAGKTYTDTKTGDIGNEIIENGPGDLPLSVGGCYRNQIVSEGFNGEMYHVEISECNIKQNIASDGAP